MEKHCTNHAESLAVASCKACSRSVCLMCVIDEKEGTFCSSECHQASLSGAPVAQAAGKVAASGDDALSSIFDADPSPSSNLNLPPSDGPEPIVAEGTKWRPIGAKCENHGDTDAVANCDRCGKAVCPLCLLEATAGTFCSSDCLSGTAPATSTEQAPLREALAAAPSAPVEKAAPQPQRRAQPVNVMATGRAQKKGGGGMAAAFILVLLAAGSYFGWDYYQKNFVPQGITPAPVVLVEPPKPVVRPPKPVVEPPKPVVQPPKPVVEPPKPVVQPPKPVVEPAKPVPIPVAIKKPEKKDPPKPRPAKYLNPWDVEEVGTWYRIRTSQNGSTTYTDIGVKAKAAGFIMLQTQVCKGGQAAPVSEQKVEPQLIFLTGEETFTFNDRPFLTEIRQHDSDPAAPKIWSLLQGQNFGAVIQAQTPQGLLVARRVWEHPLRIDQRTFDCLVVEATVEKDGAVVSTVKTWFTSQVPMGFLREERAGQITTVDGWGTNWAQRPAFPTP